MLSMLGFKSTETGRVSEEELRLIVTGAKQSGGIESQEGMMIEGVLDLQVSLLVLFSDVAFASASSLLLERKVFSSNNTRFFLTS